MGIGRLIGVFALIPASVLLTLSFFVLFAVRKVTEKWLKLFGYIAAGLLWVAVSLILSSGVYTLATGRCPMMRTMQGMMKNQCMMMNAKMVQAQKQAAQGKVQAETAQAETPDMSCCMK